MDLRHAIYALQILLLTITLSACGGSGDDDEPLSQTLAPTTPPPSVVPSTSSPNNTSETTVKLLGKVTFDRVPTGATGTGLDYDAIIVSPVRKATVQAVSSNGSVISETTTDDQGKYSFIFDKSTSMKIRVKVEMPAYNITVVDNTNNFALYVLDGSLASSGTTDSIRNLHAPSGWGGSSYTSARVSGPFAILDSLYIASEKIKAVDANTGFAKLIVNWSVNNAAATGDITTGKIRTSHYIDGNLFILGKENADTDEFDDHVMLHEWAHYFEDKFSRSDSIGGQHSNNVLLDIRVAFSEGFGNAMSGILTDDPAYKDTTGNQQGSSFEVNVENSTPKNNAGFYSESSVQRLIYDLYDSDADDVNDTAALGFAPLYNTLVNGERNAKAFTSIFTFINELKKANPNEVNAIDSVVSGENIQPITNDFGDNQIDDRNGSPHVLPIYSVLTVGGAAVNLCSVNDFGNNNKLSNIRFLRFSIATAGSYTINAVRTSGADLADIDFRVRQVSSFNKVMEGLSTVNNSEEVTSVLATGNHVMEIWEDANRRGNSGKDVCFDITLTQ